MMAFGLSDRNGMKLNSQDLPATCNRDHGKCMRTPLAYSNTTNYEPMHAPREFLIQ